MSESNGQHTPTVYGMTRASTLGQTTSQATQREILARACQSLSLGEPQFLDEPPATSGRSLKFCQRPMGLWALRHLRKGDTLIVTEMRTLGRNFIDEYGTVQVLFDRGVRVIVLKGFGGNVIDLSRSTDRLFLAILSWASDEEAARVSERTKAGLDYRRKNGLCAGPRFATYIQNYSADGKLIPKGEYDKLKGCYKMNLPDVPFLTQLCELLVFQKKLKVKGPFLYDYCKERDFVNHKGRRWWDGPIRLNTSGTFRTEVSMALRRVRHEAVAGGLPGDWNEKVLAITGDDPIRMPPLPKKSHKKKASTDGVPNYAERQNWTAQDWMTWWASHQQE